MSKGVAYFLGILTGIVLTIAAAFVISKSNNGGSAFSGLTMFEERGDMMTETSFKVLQAIDANHALAMAKSETDLLDDLDLNLNLYYGLLVLVIDEDAHFYDDQIINAKSGKRFYQVGTYRYETQEGVMKTVPAIKLLDK